MPPGYPVRRAPNATAKSQNHPAANGVARDIAMDTIEQDLRDVYEHLLRKRASEDTALEATLALARDLMPGKDDRAVRETVSRVIAEARVIRAGKPPLS
jgi:hypothetical protein